MRYVLGLLLILITSSALGAAVPRVSLEIITQPGVAPTAPQQWLQTLSSLGMNGLQIRSGSEADRPDVESVGSDRAPAYRVKGILSTDGMLHVPGGKFGIRDMARLRKWLDDLGADGVEGVTQERMAFGLTPSQIEQVMADLKQPVGFSTLNMPADQVATRIARQMRLPLAVETGAGGKLARVTVLDEFEKLTRGTALAAIARQAGLSLKPVRDAGGLGYRLASPVKGGDEWPVGWPLKKRAVDELPMLFEMLNVEITEIPVSEAIDAIQGRLGAPLIYDRLAMQLHGADPTTAPAEIPPKRLSYSQVLNKVLSQAKLQYEVRIDDADQPFLWITTFKASR